MMVELGKETERGVLFGRSGPRCVVFTFDLGVLSSPSKCCPREMTCMVGACHCKNFGYQVEETIFCLKRKKLRIDKGVLLIAVELHRQ